MIKQVYDVLDPVAIGDINQANESHEDVNFIDAVTLSHGIRVPTIIIATL